MLNFLQKIIDIPAFWLVTYACGSVMVIVAMAGGLGSVAAGSAAGFFVLGGVVGYEILSRRKDQELFSKRIQILEITQANMAGDLTSAQLDIDFLKDDNKTAASSHSSKPRASSFMPRQKPANVPAPDDTVVIDENTVIESPVISPPSRAQKYKDMLMAAARSVDGEKTKKEPPTLSAPSAAPHYSDSVISELVAHAVRNERIEIFAQPIVKLPSRRLLYLELFARIRARSGVYLTGENYRPLAERETMIENIDHLLFLHVIETIRNDARRGVSIGYFINVSSRCFRDKSFMADVLDFLKYSKDMANRLVFEMQYADVKNLSDDVQRMIDGLSKAGFLFSVDNIPDADFSVDGLSKKGFRFLKFSAEKLMNMCHSSQGELDIARMKAAADRAHITLIVERLENEYDLKELLDFEIDFGEGYLFGEPDLEMAYRPRRSA